MDTDPDWLITRPLWKLSQRNQIPSVDSKLWIPDPRNRIPRQPGILDCRSKHFPGSGIGITEEEDLVLKITWITALQRNRWLLSQMGLMVLWCTIIQVISTHNSWIIWKELFAPKTSREQLIIRRSAVLGPLRLEVRWPISRRIE